MQTFADIKLAMTEYAAVHVPLANVKDNSVYQLIGECIAKKFIRENNVRAVKRMIINGMPELSHVGVSHWLIELSGGNEQLASTIIQDEILAFYQQKATK